MNCIFRKIKDPEIWTFLILPYLSLVIIQIFFNWELQSPSVFPDEITQLGHARYLAGGNHVFLFNEPLAHFGYSLFLVPLFWLFSNPFIIFKGVVILNAFLMSSLYFPIYYIIHNIFSTKKNISLLITLTTCIYPAFFFYSKVSWAENILIPLYATTVVLLYLFLKHKSYLSAILFGVSVGFLYMLHVRILPIIIISILYLIFLVILKILPKLKVLLSLLFIGIFCFVTKVVMNYLVSVGYEKVNEISKIEKLFNIFDISDFIIGAVGQLWYLSVATYGLFIIGLFYIIYYLYQKIRCNFKQAFKNNKFVVLLFILLTSFASFMTSVLFMTNSNRIDQLIYGRYNETFISIFIALTLISFYHKKNNKKHYIFTIISLFVLTMVLYSKNDMLIDVSRRLSPIPIPSLIIWRDIFDFNHILIWPILLFSVAIFIILIKRFSNNFLSGTYILIVFFMLINLYNAVSFNRIDKAKNVDLVYTIDQMNIKDLDYNINYYDCGKNEGLLGDFLLQKNYYLFRYLLPETKLYIFYSEKGELPQHSFVISNTCWPDAKKLNAQLIMVDSYGEQTLWQIP